MKLNQSNNLPVAEIIECNVTGQQTIIEIEGRLKFLRIGDKLYTQPSQVAQPASPVQAEPVMYQERTDLRGPYSSFQGWTDWRECDKEQYEMIKEHPTIYYTAQSRALIVAAIAQPVQPIIKTVVKLTPDQEENLHAGRTTKETFTVVYLGPNEEELKVIMSHPKSIWLGWCHAPYERDEARAALTQTGAEK